MSKTFGKIELLIPTESIIVLHLTNIVISAKIKTFIAKNFQYKIMLVGIAMPLHNAQVEIVIWKLTLAQGLNLVDLAQALMIVLEICTAKTKDASLPNKMDKLAH